jgi:hypothetical protein
MKKTIHGYLGNKWPFLFLILFTACSVQNQIYKDDFNRIPKDFSAVFYDQPDTIINPYDNHIRVRSLVKDFAEVNNINYRKPIQINVKQNKLYLKFEDNNQKKYVLQFFGGKRKKKFVFYTNYQTVSFPILFMTKEMTKYTVYLSKNDELIFENHNVNEGMLLFFGAGSSSTRDYKFKLLKNE